jgi:hypothetical protein
MKSKGLHLELEQAKDNDSDSWLDLLAFISKEGILHLICIIMSLMTLN